jgi:hypothetical protein
LKANAHVPGHKDRKIEVKEQRQCDFAVAKGSMMQLWSIASRDGPVYDLLIQIISGNVAGGGPVRNSSRSYKKKPTSKEVKSAALFTNIGGIDDDTLCSLLEEIINGQRRCRS